MDRVLGLIKWAMVLALWLVLGLVVTWLTSNDAQRREYLDLLGLDESLGHLIARGRGPGAGPGRRGGVERSPAQSETEARASDDPEPHPEGIDGPCLREGPANPSRKAARQVYRWTDANGKPVYSDRPPPEGPSQVVGRTAEEGVGRFSTEYKLLGMPPDPVFERSLAANLDGVFRFLAEDLGLQGAEPVHVRLTLIAGRSAYLQYQSAKAPGLTTDGGFYTHRENEAVVRWTRSDASLAVARHEIAHLALGNWLGNPPIWLNEGLAEFIERLRFEQSYAQAPAPERELKGVRRLRLAGRLPDLRSFLGMQRKDWNRIGNEVAYPYAWSLIHFLLEDPERQAMVTDYLNALARDRCRPFDHLAFLEGHYPGGILGLESDWGAWVAKGEAKSITF